MPAGFFPSFKRLSIAERDEFELYLRTFYKGRQKEIHAFEFLKSAKRLNEQKLYEHVFAAFPKAGELRPVQNVLSALKKILLEYIAWEEMRSAPEKGAALSLRLDALRHRGWTEAYVNQVNNVKRVQARPDHKVESMWDILDKLSVSHHLYYHATDETWTDRTAELTEMFHLLNQFYGVAQLKYQCEWISRGIVLKQSKDGMDVHELREFVEHLPDQSLLPLRIYKAVLALLSSGDEQIFNDLLDLLQHDLEDKDEQWALLMYLSNFSIRMVNQGKKDYWQTTSSLYQLGLENGLFTLGGFFPIGHFHNIITIGCNLRDFDSMENFIAQYGRLLPSDARDSVQALCRAKIYFEQRKFEQAGLEIQKVDLKNMANSLQGRMLQIRIYYELPAYHSLIEAACANLNQYVERNAAVGENYKIAARNFVKGVRGLMAGKPKDELLSMLEGDLHSSPNAWLLSKINERP